MNRMRATVIVPTFLTLSIFVMSCAKLSTSKTGGTGNGGASTDDTEIAQTAVSAVQGLVITQGLALASNSENAKPSFFSEWIPSAFASSQFSCASAQGSSVNTCPSSPPYTVTRNYDCRLRLSGLSVSGTSSLKYSASGCVLPSVGSVDRTVALTISGKSAGTLTISSDASPDYRGNQISGGQRLTRAQGVYLYEVLGMHRKVTDSSGKVVYDFSTQTLTPFDVTGTSLDTLTLNQGSLEVIHNLGKYVATWTASSVKWSASCNCPISGSLSATLSGNVTGSATISFDGSCGTAQITLNGKGTSVLLDSCSS